MNKKTLKTKPKAALALALLMVIPMVLATMAIVKADNAPVLSVVLSGTTSTTVIPAQSVGSTFSADIRLDNTGSVSPGINSYSYGLSWNPAVLNVTHVNDAFSGSFLNSGANLGTVQSLGDLPPNNTEGLLVIGDIILNTTNPASCATGSGVLTTVTFAVLATGKSSINLQPSDVGVAYLTYPDKQGNSHNEAATTVNAQYTPMSISLYQSGSSNSTIQFGSGTNPINTTFSVDVYINNPLAESVWGWNIGVTWNPAVLQLETVTEGTYLGSTPGSQTLFVAGYIDNERGTIPQGISDVYLSNMTTQATAGVLATLTFKVIKKANSNINATAGTPTLIDNYDNAIPCGRYNGLFVKIVSTNIADVNGDGKVDMKDISLVARAFGSRPGDPLWNPALDVGGYGVIDMRDIAIVARNFGWTAT